MAKTLNVSNLNIEGCVMLALSTFRRSEKAIELALEKSLEIKKLMIVYVVDINVARYLVDVETDLFPDVREICEAEMLEKAEKKGRKHMTMIAEKARREGIKVRTLAQMGRFAVVCLDVVKRTQPSMIVTTRSKRPEWVKKFFGSPVDELIAKAGCPVVVV